MDKHILPLETRIERLLVRYELGDVTFRCLDDGVVEITTKGIDANDRAILVAALNALPGVRRVQT